MTKIMIKILLVNLFISLFGCQNNENIDTYLNRLHEKGELNGNVLVIKDGKTLYENSFGFTDATKNTMLNKDYRFNLGSVYKEFPAVAIMQLKEKKQINLDDKVSDYMVELPKWSEKISIKQLLQYSSGLPLIPWDDFFNKNINVTDNDIMEGLQGLERLEFEPGSDYLYSNNNPILLIKIIENITKTSFKEYVQEEILNPLGMSGTVIKDHYPYKDKTLMAIPFDTDFKEDDYKISVKSLLFSSTTHDMAIWLEQLGNFKIISKQSVKTLSEEAKDGYNIQAPLGRCDWENGKIIEHYHHGSSASYECVVRRFKQDGVSIIILTNQKHGNVDEISDEIYEIVTSE